MRSFWRVAKWLIGLGFALLIIVGGAGILLWPRIQEVLQQQGAGGGVEVIGEETVTGDITRTINAPGTVKPISEVELSARVSATIQELPFEEGDRVNAGDVVIRLDSKDLEAEVAGAEAQLLAEQAGYEANRSALAAEESRLAGTKASFEAAEREWKRQRGLRETGDNTEAELDAAFTEYESQRAGLEAATTNLDSLRRNVDAADARVKLANANLDRARENLRYAILTSPIAGVVTQLNAEVGELVVTGTMNNPGTVIMKVADLSEMLVEARINEPDIPKVQPGQPARVFINGFGDRQFEGVVKRVGLETRLYSDNTVYFDVEISLIIPEGERMFAGLTANVDIETETLKDAVLVPSQAVLDKRVEELPVEVRNLLTPEERQKTFARCVFVMDAGRALLTPVTIGASDFNQTAVVKGLEPGVTVIAGPYRALQDLTHNTAVRLEEPDQDDAIAAGAAAPTPAP